MYKKLLYTVYYHLYKMMSGNKDNVDWLISYTFLTQLCGLNGIIFWNFKLMHGIDPAIGVFVCAILWIPITIIWFRHIKRNWQEIVVNDEEYAGIGKRIFSILYVLLSFYLVLIDAWITFML